MTYYKLRLKNDIEKNYILQKKPKEHKNKKNKNQI